MSDLIDPLWGTGYGSKRHLVKGKVTRHPQKGWRVARSHCGQLLDALADQPTDAEIVASRPPCARCQKNADREAQP